MKSDFKRYSVGIVVDGYDVKKIKDKGTRDKELSKPIEIYPVEPLSQNDGKLDKTEDLTYKTKDIDDNDISTKVNKGKTLACHWIPMHGSNRYTPHIITKGMTVMIYRFADTDQYYWDTIYIEDDLKLGEYVSYAYKTEGEDYYTSSYDALNHEVLLTTPNNTPELKHLYELFVRPLEDTTGIEISNASTGSDKNFMIFKKGGKELHITIKELIYIHMKLMKIVGDVTINDVDVYKTLMNHEMRLTVLDGGMTSIQST